MTKKKKRKIIILSVIGILVIVGVVGTVITSGVRPIEVTTEAVAKQDIVHKVTASGTIQPEKQVDISANISALIMEISVEEGDSVMVGQHLISLDRTRPEAAAEQAHSRLKSGEANLVKATAMKNRAEKLFSEQLISSQELESTTATFQLAESEVELAKAALKSAMDDLSKTSLLAPNSGIVTEIRKDEGEMALGSMFQADVIMSIADLSRMEVVVEVNENDVVDVSIDDTAEIEIDAFQDTVFAGVVKEIAHVARSAALGTQDQVTNFNVKVLMLAVPPAIRQGMSATVSIITDVKNNALAIPIQSLTVRPEEPLEGGGASPTGNGVRQEVNGNDRSKAKMVEVTFVLSDTSVVEEENGPRIRGEHKFVEQREVEVGLSSETHYEVLSGLEQGERIVTGSYNAISRELKNNSAVVEKEKQKGERGDRRE